MAWTSPKTWIDGNKLSALELNEQLRDNLNYLFAKPSASYILDEAANYTTTSNSWVDIDSTNLALSITTGGGDVLVWFNGLVVPYNASTARVGLDIDVDGSRIAGDHGIVSKNTYASGAYFVPSVSPLTIVRLVTGLSAGSHTFKLQWIVNYSAVLFAGAGTTNFVYNTSAQNVDLYGDIHAQFGVREL